MEDNNKKRVLVVDDDGNLRMVVTDKLTAAGFDVIGAANGEEGLKKALEWHPDVILLDVMMPVMDGWKTLDGLRDDAWGKTARVIMLTSLEGEKEVAQALGKGIHECLQKAKLNLDDLVKMIAGL